MSKIIYPAFVYLDERKILKKVHLKSCVNTREFAPSDFGMIFAIALDRKVELNSAKNHFISAEKVNCFTIKYADAYDELEAAKMR